MADVWLDKALQEGADGIPATLLNYGQSTRAIMSHVARKNTLSMCYRQNTWPTMPYDSCNLNKTSNKYRPSTSILLQVKQIQLQLLFSLIF